MAPLSVKIDCCKAPVPLSFGLAPTKIAGPTGGPPAESSALTSRISVAGRRCERRDLRGPDCDVAEIHRCQSWLRRYTRVHELETLPRDQEIRISLFLSDIPQNNLSSDPKLDHSLIHTASVRCRFTKWNTFFRKFARKFCTQMIFIIPLIRNSYGVVIKPHPPDFPTGQIFLSVNRAEFPQLKMDKEL